MASTPALLAPLRAAGPSQLLAVSRSVLFLGVRGDAHPTLDPLDLLVPLWALHSA